MNETSPEQSRSTTFEIVPERYETIATAYPGTTDGQISSTKQTIKPALPDINYPIPFTQTIAPNIRAEIEKEGKLELPEVISQPTTYTYPSFNATRITSPKPVGIVPNRLRGKAHLICKEDGLQFGINTLFPFTGQIFARDRKPAAQCYFTFHEATSVRVMMPYSTCGIRNIEQQSPETQYHMQIIVIFQQKDNTSTMQSFLTQCIHQKVQYRKQVIPKRIEEALEELRLVPMKLEHKAQIPECMMRIVTEEEHGHGDDGTEIEIVNLGQPMRIEWSLVPESDAYGFHVRNCTVRDTVSNTEYVVIDEQGCSTDINIFSHPHYDTYHDIARVHWHAFKVPDINQLSIKCSIEICTDIPDTTSGLTNCDNIPSPPFCPDLITSATNALLSDYEKKVIRKRREHKSFQQHVHADICFGDKKDEYCSSENYQTDRERHINMFKDNSRKQYCFPRLWLTIWTGLSVLTALLAITVYGYCHCSRRRRYASIKLTANSKITTTKQQQ
ncbi:unnamed protein product [Onchocerca ochengi]|uniref:ZP domain-containing protein n=1 Tax=Onchocerca ochengi TaxID=42157 RepID=A0A182ED84_ONCOC|nr:unnamed protein product [Onchocerca ochengi]